MHQNFSNSTSNLPIPESAKKDTIINHDIQNSNRQDYITGTFPSPIKSQWNNHSFSSINQFQINFNAKNNENKTYSDVGHGLIKLENLSNANSWHFNQLINECEIPDSKNNFTEST